MTADPKPGYWEEYSNLQRQKHQLIRCYLGGWFAKLGSWAGRVFYLDTHAGRGKHLRGELGSPLVALDTLLSHTYRDKLLERSEFVFWFIERDENNLNLLKSEIAIRGSLPSRIKVREIAGDCFKQLGDMIKSLRQNRSRLAPAFVFVDPYGFKVPIALLRNLMHAGKVELFINVIWRELNMALVQANSGDDFSSTGVAKTLDYIFDGADWRHIDSSDFDTRANQAIDLIREKLGAKWATSVRMLGDNRQTRYILSHFTNHDSGRDLMKDCVWKVCPDGRSYVRKWDDPSQEILIRPNPDLRQLQTWLVEKLRERAWRWSELEAALRPDNWRATHLNSVIRELRSAGKIIGENYAGRFGRKADPLLRLRN